MLGKVGQGDQNNKEILAQNAEIMGVGAVKEGKYSKIDKNLLIDETNISQDAIKLWEREMDVQRFTRLALSDPDDKSAEALVKAQKLSIDDDEALFALLDNQQFLSDIAI